VSARVVIAEWLVIGVAGKVSPANASVIFINEHKNGEKRENNDFVNEN